MCYNGHELRHSRIVRSGKRTRNGGDPGVVMVAGNAAVFPRGLFSSFRVLTANIVMEMGYAGEVQEGALIATGAVLLLILAVDLVFGLTSGGFFRQGT